MSGFMVNQIYVFSIFIILGFAIGFIFDFFRILRRIFKTPDFVTYIEDIMFWIISCFLFAYCAFKYNSGELRLFLFIGLFIGIMLYILIFSRKIIKSTTKIILPIKNFFTKIAINFVKKVKNKGL